MAELFIWRDEYLIGINELDYEHKDMFVRLNVLHQELLLHDTKEIIEESLGEIYSRYLAHFALEEDYMRNHKTPNYQQHKKEHDDFLEDITEMIYGFLESSGLGTVDELEELLQSWTLKHIITTDRELVLKGTSPSLA